MPSQPASGKKPDDRSSAQGEDNKRKVQGEGDYESNRRYTQSVEDFVESGQVDAAARAAMPRTQQESDEMREAEREGASHAKGGPPSPDHKSP